MSKSNLSKQALFKMLEGIKNKPLYVALVYPGVKTFPQKYIKDIEVDAESYNDGGKLLVPKEITSSDGFTFLTFQEVFWDNLKGIIGGFIIYDKSDDQILFSQLFDEPCQVPGSRFKIRFGAGVDAPFSLKNLT